MYEASVAMRALRVHGMWATLETWLLSDGEVPELGIDEVLPHKGLRLNCDAFGPSAETTPGTWAMGTVGEGDITYRLHGVVVAAWRQAAVVDIGAALVLLEPGAVRAIQTPRGDDALEALLHRLHISGGRVDGWSLRSA